jgi:hypothetical protein
MIVPAMNRPVARFLCLAHRRTVPVLNEIAKPSFDMSIAAGAMGPAVQTVAGSQPWERV